MRESATVGAGKGFGAELRLNRLRRHLRALHHQMPSSRPTNPATTITRTVKTAGFPNAPAWKRPHRIKMPWAGLMSDMGAILAILGERIRIVPQGVLGDGFATSASLLQSKDRTYPDDFCV